MTFITTVPVEDDGLLITMQLTTTSVVPQRRTLKAKWSVELEQDIAYYNGLEKPTRSERQMAMAGRNCCRKLSPRRCKYWERQLVRARSRIIAERLERLRDGKWRLYAGVGESFEDVAIRLGLMPVAQSNTHEVNDE